MLLSLRADLEQVEISVPPCGRAFCSTLLSCCCCMLHIGDWPVGQSGSEFFARTSRP